MSLATAARLYGTIGRAVSPRRKRSVSEWADAEFRLSSKGNAMSGEWRTERNPPLREPLDCMSASSTVHDVVCKFPIQFGKTAIGLITAGYVMDEDPGPLMQVLPDDESMKAWINQKLQPTIDVTPALQRALTSVSSRNASNTKSFKDFAGGQLFVEHAGTPTRLKLKTIRHLIVDELDSIVRVLGTGDDPVEMLKGRTSSYPSTHKRLWIGSPSIKTLSRIDEFYEASDRRKYHVPCPHCGELQTLEWSGLQWTPDGKECWYVCRENGCMIEEHHKTQMIAWGRWIAENPSSPIRGYTINCLYYQFGLGPRWIDLVGMWRAAQGDPAKLKTFVNDRLAEAWEDPSMRNIKVNVIQDRAESYRLRRAVRQVLAVTAGVDTQDNRLAVQTLGWGRGMASWTLDYTELDGDPADDAVWVALVDLLNRPIEHALGGLIRVEATAIDMLGHRTEAVKAFVRSRRIRRPMAIHGNAPANAPVLGKGRMQDVTFRGALDKRGVTIHAVGTIGAKHWLYGRLSTDADKDLDHRLVHFSEDLPPEFFTGIVSETFNPAKGHFVKRTARNEPLDTYIYAYAAAHHPELRLHRRTQADWDAAEAKIRAQAPSTPAAVVAARIAASDAPTPAGHEWGAQMPRIKLG